jgi:predicted RNA binding protein YcfA (HicA-like mRNA interferase family)
MGDVPVLKPREVEERLFVLGIVLARQRGSHRQYRHPDGRATTVPHHSYDIAPALLRQIAKDIGVPVRDFVDGRGG